ncbi:MAG: hypothetical protein JXR96_23060 [Deltaproteobacteria bacterium]|nr:hypothetical protein [Deltaproteobacteria bacterium]
MHRYLICCAILLGGSQLGCEQNACELYHQLAKEAWTEACIGQDDACWFCRCYNQGLTSVHFDSTTGPMGHACIDEPPAVDLEYDCSHKWTESERECAADEAACKQGFLEVAEMYCEGSSPVTPCEDESDCLYSEEYCLEGVCTHLPCACDDGSEDLLCESSTCQREGEMCQMGFCALEGF